MKPKQQRPCKRKNVLITHTKYALMQAYVIIQRLQHGQKRRNNVHRKMQYMW